MIYCASCKTNFMTPERPSCFCIQIEQRAQEIAAANRANEIAMAQGRRAKTVMGYVVGEE